VVETSEWNWVKYYTKPKKKKFWILGDPPYQISLHDVLCTLPVPDVIEQKRGIAYNFPDL
jgi:hypothetical protein